VVGTFREFERAATTEIDAALSPLLARYLHRLGETCRQTGLPEPRIMQSTGGLIDLETAASHAVRTVLSGPAAGAAGAAFLARATGEPRVLCMDMGGTSCDICVVDDGAVQERGAAAVGGRPIALPMLAIHTVGAGGGSIAWRDAGGALRVGPQSAGAEPGPACYGRGGTEPTVSDANLLLGLLPLDAPLAGGVSLDREAAARAVGRLAHELRMDPIACAEGIRRVAGGGMAGALRVVTVHRGVDPRAYALMAFGGAGPLHAAQIADELGIETILCPRDAGVLAALGLVVAERRRDAQRSVLFSGETLTESAIGQVTGELAEQARRELGDPDADTRATYELRYRGQSFELPVGGELETSPEELRRGFEAVHEERYGYSAADQALELVTIRVTATLPGGRLELGTRVSEEDVWRGRRRVWLDGREQEAEVVAGAPAPGTGIYGPSIVELPGSTLVLPSGWRGGVEASGMIRVDRVR